MFGDADLGVFFADWGAPVLFGGVTVNGTLNLPRATKLADEGFGGISVQQPTIELPYNAFNSMPQQGDTIVVAGVSYTIADEAADVDGAILRYPLKAVS